ncbi:MAG: SRPBCC family protein, partial [Actinomycetota bacterium]
DAPRGPESEPERDHVRRGAYTEVVPGERIGYPWPAAGIQEATTVEFTVEDDGDGARVALRHRGRTQGSDESGEHHEQGWGFFLQSLKSVLEEGTDRRAEILGMKVAGG